MNKYDFWKIWTNRTRVEEKAIASVVKARDRVINSVPNEVLVSIYIKGSFARREMKKGSEL